VITAKLKGFHEATAKVTAEKGGVATAPLELRPLEPPPSAASAPSSSTPGSQGAVNAPEADRPEPRPKPAAPTWPKRIVVGAGPAVLWGLAPSPVVGPSVSISVRWEVVSAGGGVRAMWSLPVGREGPVIGVGAYGASAHGCGHWGPAFGCALFQVAAVELGARTGASEGSTGMLIVPALGLSGGLEVPQRSRIQARFRGEISSALRRPGASVEGRLVWESPGFVGGATIEAVFAF
jgi:hypothetical protein